MIARVRPSTTALWTIVFTSTNLNCLDRIISSSTGHQVADYPRDRQHYMEDRGRKLDVQRAAAPESSNRQVLSNVRVYINGFLNNTTDIEMKKIVIRAGGQIVWV